MSGSSRGSRKAPARKTQPAARKVTARKSPTANRETVADPFELADLLLRRAVVVAHAGANRGPDPLAGLKVDDRDVARLLAELGGAGPARTPRALASLDRAIEGARARVAADTKSAFAAVVAASGLEPVEAEVLAVLVAVEADPRRQRLVGYLNDDVTLRRCTPFTIRELFGAARGAELAVAPGRGLVRAALVSLPTDAPWGSAAIAVARPVVWWLAGERDPDPDLPPGYELLDVALDSNGVDLVVVSGPDRIRRLQAACAAVRGRGLLATPLPASDDEWAAVVRNASLSGRAVVVEVDDKLPAAARARIEDATHVGWVVSSREALAVATLPRRPWVEVIPDAAQATAQEWTALVGEPRAGSRLGAEQLELLARATSALGEADAGVQRLAAGTIDRLASRIRPSRGWDDIVLDDERRALLRDVVARWEHRGTVYDDWGFSAEPSAGVVALFSGPSGTGKTLASEIIAGTLGFDLYRVDLSQLVSKYIGETEKHLAEVFDAAEQSDVVLLFDEADALLGKRSEVSDAHDRYANIEVAYLLQRLERYHGLVVMTTNLAQNIDDAFQRRVHVGIQFPMPGVRERRAIWRMSIPKAAPAEDLDLEALARDFELSGGSIRNAALAAAFIAADEGCDITMEIAVVAVRRELRKLGRLLDDERPRRPRRR
jgi:hypothetical protein